ncbi:MAG: hypothetical protein NC133_04565 [Prevotella sp.]|nr:hypothetical protein [Prevotella sp.]
MSNLIKDCGVYTTIPGNITHDKDLDLKSRGMLLTLLSLPDNWNFSERGLVKIFNNEGRASIRSTLKKLEELGYLKRVQGRGVDGAFGNIDYIISDTRQEDFLADTAVVRFLNHGGNENTVVRFSDHGKSNQIYKRNK